MTREMNAEMAGYAEAIPFEYADEARGEEF
jgi:hypothetical protein